MVVDLVSALENIVSTWEQLGHPALLERFVLRNGVLLTGSKRPRGIRRREIKQCFSNSTTMVLRYPAMHYYEGLALSEGLPMPIHHAWCVADGKVLDLTWQNPENCVYMGVHIPFDTLIEQMRKNEVYGVLDTGRGLNTEYMFGQDPELKEILHRVTSTPRSLIPL